MSGELGPCEKCGANAIVVIRELVSLPEGMNRFEDVVAFPPHAFCWECYPGGKSMSVGVNGEITYRLD
jgi:hypothetical protein